MKLDIDIYAQAGSEVGLGHFSRASRIANQLIGLGANPRIFVDGSLPFSVASWPIPIEFSPPLCQGANALVDGIVVPFKRLVDWTSYRKVFSTSPLLFKEPFIDSVFVREKPQTPNHFSAKFIVDSNFYWASLDTRLLVQKPNRARYSISGYASAKHAPRVVSALRGLAEKVNGLRFNLILPASHTHLQILNAEVRVSTPIKNQWNFLSQAKYFVGGDGLAIAEAVSRGLVVISLTDLKGAQKNKLLFQRRMAFASTRVSSDVKLLERLVLSNSSSNLSTIAIRKGLSGANQLSLVTAILKRLER